MPSDVVDEASPLMRCSSGQRYTEGINSAPTTLLSNNDGSSPHPRSSHLSVAECQPEVIIRGSSPQHSDVSYTSFCSGDCFWYVIKILFGCGNSNESDRQAGDRNGDSVSSRNSNNSPYTAYVGPIVLALVMFSVSCSQEIAIYVSDYPEIVMHLFKSAYIFLSIGVLIVIKFCKTGRPSDDNIEKGRPKEMLFAMWIFWLFGVILDIAEVHCIAYCSHELIEHDHKDTKTLVIHAFYHVIRPLFNLILVIFCTYYHHIKAIFEDTVRYGLMIILATMFSIWFELLFDEAKYKSQKNDKSNVTIEYNTSSTYSDCYGTTPESLGNVKWIRSICVPGMIEFTLLIVECFIHWFVRCRPRADYTLVSQSSTAFLLDLCDDTRFCPDREQVQGSDVGSQHSHVSEGSSGISSNSIKSCRNLSYIIYILSYPSSIALSVTFAIFYNYSHHFGPTGKFATFFCAYSIVWYVCNFAVTFSAVAVTRNFKPKHGIYKDLNGLEHLLLLALLGPLLLHCFTIITVIHEWNCVDIVNPWAQLFREIFNTFQILTQVPLIFLAKRITIEPVDYRKSSVTTERGSTECITAKPESCTGSENEVQPHPVPDISAQTHFYSDDTVMCCPGSHVAGDSLTDSIVSAELSSPDSNEFGQSRPNSNVSDQSSHQSNVADQSSSDSNISGQSRPNSNISDQSSPNLGIADQSHPDFEIQIGISTQYYKRICKFILLAGIFHLAANNAAYWYVDTFIYSQESPSECNSSDSIYLHETISSETEPSYFDPAYWPVISGVIDPLHIFYRFHSMLLLIGAWLSFVIPKKKKKEESKK